MKSHSLWHCFVIGFIQPALLFSTMQSDLWAQGPLPPADKVLLCSDFLYPQETLAALLSTIAGDDVHLCVLYDSAEASFPYQGPIRFRDLAGGGDCLVEDAQALRTSYQARYAEHTQALDTLAAQRGWRISRYSTEGPLMDGV